MANANVVIEIGEKNIKIVEGLRDREKLVIKNFSTVRTPSATIKRGSIIDAKSIGQVVQEELLSRGIKTKEAILVLSGDVAVNREVVIKKVKEKEIPAILPIESAQYFPVDLTGYNLDYKFIEEFKQDDSDMYRLYVSAVQTNIINQYINMIQYTDLKLNAIDIASNALCKLAKMECVLNNGEKGGFFSVIDVGYSSVRLIVMEGSKIKYEKVIPVGANKLIELISMANNVGEEQAEKLLFENFEKYMANSSANMATLDSRIYKVVNGSICGSIVKLFDFYISRNGNKPIDKIFLTGGALNVPGMENEISKFIGIECETLRNLRCVVDKTGVDFFKDILMYSNVLGALIRE